MERKKIMLNLIQAEWQKLRRCQILLIGIVALTLCPVVQYGTQLVVAPEYRDAAFDFTKLFANVVWGNSQMFLPISLVMLGGWLIGPGIRKRHVKKYRRHTDTGVQTSSRQIAADRALCAALWLLQRARHSPDRISFRSSRL